MLFDGQQAATIVCADSGLVVAQSIIHQPISLEDYVQMDYGRNAPQLTPDQRSLLRAIQGWQFTDITDVRLVQRMSRLNTNFWDRVLVRSARTVQLQDFKNGNIVLLGSSHSNPWILLFEPQLNFRFGFDFDTTGEKMKMFSLSFLKPLTLLNQLTILFLSLLISFRFGDLTPVFSMNNTLLPFFAKVDMISWWPCHMKSQSIEDMQIIFSFLSIYSSALTLFMLTRKFPKNLLPDLEKYIGSLINLLSTFLMKSCGFLINNRL